MLYTAPDKNRFLPLTSSDQLRAIYEADPSTTVRRLLWEIYRPRVVAIHARDFVHMVAYHESGARLEPQSRAMFNKLRRVMRK